MTAAAFFFALMNTLVRIATDTLPPLEVAFFRNLFAVASMLPWILSSGFPGLTTRHLRLHLLRSVVGVIAMGFWFTSLAYVPLADAVALNFTMPLFIVAGAALILGETVGLRRWSATAIGFLGMLVILRPGVAEVSLVMVLPVVFVWVWPRWEDLVVLAGLGLLAMLAHLALARSLAVADASAIMPFDYARLPFVALFAFVLFGEVAEIWTWVGAAIIAGSAFYIVRREAVLAKKQAAMPPVPPLSPER
jgi:drug/metabolite transporter (DMT)-like permease